jgi:hypothetical protein
LKFLNFIGVYAYFPAEDNFPQEAAALPERINAWYYVLFMISFGTICLFSAMHLESKKYNLKAILAKAKDDEKNSQPSIIY